MHSRKTFSSSSSSIFFISNRFRFRKIGEIPLSKDISIRINTFPEQFLLHARNHEEEFIAFNTIDPDLDVTRNCGWGVRFLSASFHIQERFSLSEDSLYWPLTILIALELEATYGNLIVKIDFSNNHRPIYFYEPLEFDQLISNK